MTKVTIKNIDKNRRNTMNQSERRRYLIQELTKENPQYNNLQIPQTKEEQKQLLRSLMNIRVAPQFLMNLHKFKMNI